MVKFEKILSSIILKLETKIPGIDVQSQDIEEGFSRPSFFVELDNIKIDDFMKNLQEKNITARIIYFPSDKKKNQVELLQMMDSLNDCFLVDNVLKLDEDTTTQIETINIEEVDNVLHLDFDIYLAEMYIRDIIEEMMEELNLEQEAD